jgi:hypothetical protein
MGRKVVTCPAIYNGPTNLARIVDALKVQSDEAGLVTHGWFDLPPLVAGTGLARSDDNFA